MSDKVGPGTEWLRRIAAKEKTERAFQEMVEQDLGLYDQELSDNQ